MRKSCAKPTSQQIEFMHYQLEAPCGSLRGTSENGAIVFRNVPYAAAPVGELRFLPPQPLQRWSGVRDATAEGPVPPQGKSRLLAVTGGDFALPQSEDCLTLTVTAASDGEVGRPVLVWIHGGGFVGGAGSLPWYAGDSLARRGDVVVVSLNFRQGALGHLYLPGVSSGNLALLDIVAGLQWIQRNIRAFGGDPSRVTVFGQSTGGIATAALLDMPAAQGLFRRAIIQSAPLGRPLRSVAQATALGERFAGCLGVDPKDAGGFRAASVPALLAAQGEFARSFRPAVVGASEQPFLPVEDGKVLLPRGTGWGHRVDTAVDLVVGTLREEQAAAYFVDPAVQGATSQQAFESFSHVAGEGAEKVLAHYRSHRPGATPAALLGDLFTDVLFRHDTLRFAESHTQSGRRSWVYQFDWPSPAGFGACHCLELPFVFGTLKAFSDAPMLKDVELESFQGLSEVMQDAWIAFARSGDPNHPNLPVWEPYGPDRVTLRFDRQTQAIRDLAGFDSHPLR